jgi:hypothetical protein
LDDCIELSYLGEDSLYADACIYGMELSVFVQTMHLGGLSGRVCLWTHDTFRSNVRWLAEQSDVVRLLDRALTSADFAGGLPSELGFLWIEPGWTEGLGLSKQGRKALRGAVVIIKDMLSKRGFMPENIAQLATIYQLDLFHASS